MFEDSFVYLNQDFMSIGTTDAALDPSGMGDHLSPERALLSAILERAIRDVGTLGTDGDDAREWVFNPNRDHQMSPFSFSWLCEHLDFDRWRIRASTAALYHQFLKDLEHPLAPTRNVSKRSVEYSLAR